MINFNVLDHGRKLCYDDFLRAACGGRCDALHLTSQTAIRQLHGHIVFATVLGPEDTIIERAVGEKAGNDRTCGGNIRRHAQFCETLVSRRLIL